MKSTSINAPPTIVADQLPPRRELHSVDANRNLGRQAAAR